MLNTLNGMENRILREEIADLEKLPSYEQAKRDTLISMGSPSSPGAYKDGWDNAVSLFANESYETGYHTAIAQFSYQQTPHNKYLVPEPKNKEVASK